MTVNMKRFGVALLVGLGACDEGEAAGTPQMTSTTGGATSGPDASATTDDAETTTSSTDAPGTMGGTTSSSGNEESSSGEGEAETTSAESSGGATPACDVDPDALPIIPCGEGYGITTPAGSGRHLDPPATTVMVVTSLADEGPGTLRECAEASGPRTCVFEVGGTIDITDFITVTSPYLTIAGQTAPSPGISLHGAGIRIRTDDVLVQHVRVRVGDRMPGPPVHNRDAIWISNPDDPPERIVIDHCSLSLSSDEMLSVWYEAGDVTVVDSVLGWALNDSIHIDEGASETAPHGFGPLLGQWGARVYFGRNALVHQEGRNPLSRTAELVFANNLVHNFGPGGSVLQGDNPTMNMLVGNVYQRGEDTPNGREPIRVDCGNGCSVFIEDLSLDGVLVDDPWAEVDMRSNDSAIADSPPTALVPAVMPADEVRDYLAEHAGAWPHDRDAIDTQLVSDFVEGTGRIINCVEDDGTERCSLNAGGWPDPGTATHVLSLPADPMGDDDADGYTNLEAWLHARAAQVEGT